MSGAQNLNLVPINIGRISSQSKAAIFTIKWAKQPGIQATQINLQQQDSSGQFANVQAVYIDNTTCPFTVVLTCQQTNQAIIVDRFTNGYFPLIVTSSPLFDIELLPASMQPFATMTTTFFFLNSYIQQQINELKDYGNSPSVQPISVTGNAQQTFQLLPVFGAPFVYTLISVDVYGVLSSAAANNGQFTIIIESVGTAGTIPLCVFVMEYIAGRLVLEPVSIRFNPAILVPNPAASLQAVVQFDTTNFPPSINYNLYFTVATGSLIVQ
jgi:hypothetical protein